jgi:hypothetical protein
MCHSTRLRSHEFEANSKGKNHVEPELCGPIEALETGLKAMASSSRLVAWCASR